jgi:hypothetical protein
MSSKVFVERVKRRSLHPQKGTSLAILPRSSLMLAFGSLLVNMLDLLLLVLSPSKMQPVSWDWPEPDEVLEASFSSLLTSRT